MQKFAILSSLLAAVLAGPVDLVEPQALWQPAMGTKWQIILSSTVKISGGVRPADATVWDLDLFETDKATISSLKSQGHKVICYYSAGTYEPGRPDSDSFPKSVIGAKLPDWPGEAWLDVRSDKVFKIMAARIKLAADKGCDAIDPDNMDAYDNQKGGGFSLTTSDAVSYLKRQAAEAASHGMSIGLKNAQAIVSQVANDIQFAVNEQCAQYDECDGYSTLTRAKKPVLHIEYLDDGGSSGSACRQGFSTVLKHLSLDGWVQYCDGSQVTTPTT